MGNVTPAVEWYRRRIHQKQRRATALSIEVGLNAEEEEDPGALVGTIECLETAIGILEEAKAVGTSTSEAVDAQRTADLASPPEGLMDDLGHSMAPIDFTESRSLVVRVERRRSRLLGGLRASFVPDWPAAWDDSARFFA
jgi:hypothetical protein